MGPPFDEREWGAWAASLRFSAGAAFLGVAAAGLLVGLAVPVKVSAVVALPFVVILAVRQRVLVPVLLAVSCAGLTLAAVTAALGLDSASRDSRNCSTRRCSSPASATGRPSR